MKKVLITGGSRGVGKAAALAFAAKGYIVGFTYCHSEKDAQCVLRQLQDKTNAFSFHCDFNELTQVKRLVDDVRNQMGPLDLLILNAGISGYGLIQDHSDQEIHRIMNINCTNQMILARDLVSDMIPCKKGHVIAVSSVWGEVGAACEVIYSASKAAMIGFTKGLSKELAPSNIRVNCVTPGVINTDMISGFSSAERELIIDDIPMNRIAEPEELANLLVHLDADDISYLTGQVIGFNGGFH